MQQGNDRKSDFRILIDQFHASSGSMELWLKTIQVPGERSQLLIVPARAVHSPPHLISAVHKAWKAVFRKENRARDNSIEVLRWLSGSRQVSTALEMMNVIVPETIIVAALPEDFGRMDPSDHDLMIERTRMKADEDSGLEVMDGDIAWSGDVIKAVFTDLAGTSEEDLLLAVLEKVALTEL